MFLQSFQAVSRLSKGRGAALALILASALPCAAAPIVVFEHAPEANSNFISRHTIGGPVLADDFDPAAFPVGYYIGRAEWWGNNNGSTAFEITFHFGQIGTGGFGEPRAIPAGAGGIKFFVNVTAQPVPGTGLWYYVADIPLVNGSGLTFPVQSGPRPFGSEYWFSVANADPGWTWAFAGSGPTIGDEHWSAVRSVGGTPCGDGGPHCGPWSEIQGRDFAFRLSAVPEPSTLMMISAGLALVFIGRRRLTAIPD